MEVEKQIFQTVTGPPIVYLIKRSCFGAFYIKFGAHASSAGGIMYFIVT